MLTFCTKKMSAEEVLGTFPLLVFLVLVLVIREPVIKKIAVRSGACRSFALVFLSVSSGKLFCCSSAMLEVQSCDDALQHHVSPCVL